MDEKEVYVIKTCDQGKPRFDVLALQQPEDADGKGLKSSLDCAIDKAKLTVDRKLREIGLGSDGTNTNKALYRLEKEEIGDHLILVLCVSNKLELAIHDAFKKSKLNDAAEEQLVVTYYLFKRANLKWRLFKRHALLMKKSSRCYKRPFGTRWVAHQSDVLEAFLHNLDLLLGYLNNQIADPYNTTMKKETPRLEGVLASCSDTITLIFQCVKVDLLKLIRPTSLVLESVSILLPEAITTIGVTLKKVKKLMRKLNENGVDALRDESLFPTLKNAFLPSLDFDEEGFSLGRSTRKDPAYTGVTTFAGYTLNRGNLENVLSKVYDDVMLVLPALELALDERLSFLANDPILSSAAVLLETTAYQNRDEEDLEVPNDLIVDEVSYEVKNVCDLMNAVFFEAVVCEIRRLLKEKCPGCEVDHPNQRRHDYIMLSDEEGWLLHGLEAVERVIERGIVKKQFLEAIRVMKLEYYERAKEHYANLIKDCEVTLDFLGDLRGSFSDYEPILNYLMYWSEEHCA
ncbi:Hypothetical predicted protein [Paramuricea clavata]|uniref:Uncharacterized protein n=1 Tax=Paramuricea clavata TaxID=317549 RepID=A0A6S7J8X2_PARCT|nr:Hypothetical predicted protein [Paramuricea clavata]